MLGPLIFIMTVVPFVEIYFLLNVGKTIGAMNTFAIIILTGIMGAFFLKRQGAAVIREAQTKMGQSQLPADALIKGVFTFLGGVLLLTPGFLTDGIGFSLIFPVTQFFWRRFFEKRIRAGIANGNIHVMSPFGPKPRSPYQHANDQARQRPVDDNIIDITATSKKTEPVE